LHGRSAPIWAWFKPAHAPLGVVLRVPAATLQVEPNAISVRALIAAVGLDPRQVATWTVQGATYATAAGTNPLLDYPLHSAGAGSDVEVLIQMLPQWQPAPGSVAAPVPAGALAGPVAAQAPQQQRPTGRGTQEAVFSAIEADWNSILQLERQCAALRKQLGALQGKLQSLNRDLSPDEHRAADNADRKDWQDARRFLRDAIAIVSRQLREHDIGVTSNAGNRLRFEQTYNEHIAPRKPMEGLALVQQEFESYRKTVQSVMQGMQSALSNASRDGEQRAMRVLNRIAAKARNERSTRPKQGET
jgi:hypothetical protein